MKLLIYLTLCWVARATHIMPRLVPVSRGSQRPVSFRPGVLLKPWPMRQGPQQQPQPVAMTGAPLSHYYVRSYPQKYIARHAIKQYSTGRFRGQGKNTPQNSPRPHEYEFVRAVAATAHHHADGAIHTIPAPNLSFSEKPIVVLDSDVFTAAPDLSKPVYEVTEKYPSQIHKVKIDQPIGFSKHSLPSPDLQTLVHNGAALQLASEFGLNAIALPHSAVVSQSHRMPQYALPTAVYANQIMPQAFGLQGFNHNLQEIIQATPDALVISPNAMYQADPNFLQKLTSLIVQNFPGVQFVPYPAEVTQQLPSNVNQRPILQQPQESQLYVVQNEPVTKQPPSSFVANINKHVASRTTEEATVTLVPQELVANRSEQTLDVKPLNKLENITFELITAESHPLSTTVKYVEASTEEPVYYAQVDQVLANELYNAINDIKAAAALNQVEKALDSTQENTTETNADDYYNVQYQDSETQNQTITQMKPLGIGVPFTKSPQAVVGYSAYASQNNDTKQTKDDVIYDAQLFDETVKNDRNEATNKVKDNTFQSRRAPLRIVAVTEKTEPSSSTTSAPKKVILKAKLPPKSKLTFDDKTGEPVLRIYASYPARTAIEKEVVPSKQLQHKKEVTRKHDSGNVFGATGPEGFKATPPKTFKGQPPGTMALSDLDKSQGFGGNQVTEFGLKLRSRHDDYPILFEEDEEFYINRDT